MESLINTAASQHSIHLARAKRALECVPPRFDLFYFHSALCKAVVKSLDILQQTDWKILGREAPLIPLDDILSSLQPKEDAASSSKNKQQQKES